MLRGIFKSYQSIVRLDRRQGQFLWNLFKKSNNELDSQQKTLKVSEESQNKNLQSVKEKNEKFEVQEQQMREDFLEEVWEGKDEFIRQRREEREKEEKELEKYRSEIDFRDTRYIREQEVNLSDFDSVKILRENADLLKNQKDFKSLKDLLNFVGGLRVRISEENLIKCVKGFISLSEEIETTITENIAFQEFLDLIVSNINLISKDENLLLVVQFSDLYCVEGEFYWEALERKIVSRINQMKIEEILIPILEGFSNQKEGSEFFYDQLEGLFLGVFEELKFSSKVSVANCYFKVQKGTIEFFLQINEIILKQIGEADFDQIILLTGIFRKMKNKNINIFDKLRKQILDLIEKNKQNEKSQTLNWKQCCQVLQAFGFEQSQTSFSALIEQQFLSINPQIKSEQFEEVFQGFIYNYQGSTTIFEQFKPLVLEKIQELPVKKICQIVSSYHVAEQDDKNFFMILEKQIVSKLKDVQSITIEEIYDIVKSYTVTRVGSREIYKLLEIVIKFKFEEIKSNDTILKGLYVYYTKSGLISPETLRQIELLM